MASALVTGATSGLGKEFCWQLAEQGHDLILVARNQGRLERTAQQLQTVTRAKIDILAADLADPLDLTEVCKRVSSVDIVVNNAGFGLGESFLNGALDRELYALDVMVQAVMATCHFAGRAMRERGRGAIINVSSVAADTGMGTYSAHKAWVRAFTEGLSEELRGTGVSATVVLPGLVRTEFHERMGADLSDVPQFVWGDPGTVVRDALKAARRKQVVVTPTALYKAVGGLSRIAPRSVVRAVTRRLPHT